LLGNEKESVTYKHKLFHTACVFFSMFALVWTIYFLFNSPFKCFETLIAKRNTCIT
jgi:hypothetical protein